MAVWQSPITLNALLGTQTVMDESDVFILDGMTKVLSDGTRVPSLAKEVPTVQNGGVSADGKTITYKLKDGLKWSDGQPLTCEDAKYTWASVDDARRGRGLDDRLCRHRVGRVAPIPTPSSSSTRISTRPTSRCSTKSCPSTMRAIPRDMKNWAYNRKPLGSGPFKLDEWVADSYITLSRNPNYREKDKPYLDQIVIRIVPSTEVAMQLLSSAKWTLCGTTPKPISRSWKDDGVKISDPLQIGGERMFLNMAENKDPSDRRNRT